MILNFLINCSVTSKFLNKYFMRFSMSNISNKIEISFLSNGYLNFSKSILIVTTNNRYLINCGEGTQKMFIENGKKLNSLKNVFLTSKSPQNMNGLIGLALGMAECNNFELCLHGIKESIDLLMLTKKIGEDKISQINFHDEPVFNDSLISATKFLYGSLNHLEQNECVGYLFSSKKMRPKLDVEKCKSLGIPPSILKSSKMAEFFKSPSVLFQDDLIIQSKNVLIEPPIPDQFLVLECPSLDYIPSMSTSLPFHKLNTCDGLLKLVIHLTDKHIFNSSHYKNFVTHINSHFAKDALPLHIVMDSDCTIPLSYSTFYLQTCLNKLFDSEVFPQLKLFDEYVKSNVDRLPIKNINTESVQDGDSTFDVIYSEPFMEFILNDTKRVSNKFVTDTWSSLVNLNEDTVIQKIFHENESVPMEFMVRKMDELKKNLLKAKESLGEIKSENYPYITFIGTSSATPSKYRNISCVLIEAYSDVNVIFDAGEGSLDRIITMYGLERTKTIIRNLQMICISHDHLDHHSGLYLIMKYRQSIGQCKRCVLVVTRNVKKFAEGADAIYNTDYCSYNCDWFPIDLLKIDHNQFSIDYPRTILDNYEEKLNLKLTPVRVYHTKTSYGFVLTGDKADHDEKWKITYSGDRTPKLEGLVQEGMESDILIHEATMDDCLTEMAEHKRHSTVSQAINEGIRMKAKFIILTHFSSRYPLVPPVDEKHKNVVQAFDFMRINLQTCQYLKVLDPYLEYLFPTHWAMLMIDREKALREQNIQKNKKRKIDF